MVRMLGNEGVSFSAIRTRCMVGDADLGVGTSFFYAHGSRVYLVTAGHNITGRNSETGKSIHSSAAIPDRIQLNLCVPKKAGDSRTVMVSSSWKEVTFEEIWSDSSELVANMHPDGLDVDVVAIGPFILDMDIVTRPVNDEAYDPTPLALEFGDDAFVLGYPHFVDGGASFLPIWKRGSIASDPSSARILVDTATRAGMSGAPVFARQSGLITPRTSTPEEVPLDDRIIGTAQEFIGCYSGRLGERDQLDSQLGIVWATSAIDRVIAEGVALDLPE